jgi:hypothetical protein
MLSRQTHKVAPANDGGTGVNVLRCAWRSRRDAFNPGNSARWAKEIFAKQHTKHVLLSETAKPTRVEILHHLQPRKQINGRQLLTQPVNRWTSSGSRADRGSKVLQSSRAYAAFPRLDFCHTWCRHRTLERTASCVWTSSGITRGVHFRTVEGFSMTSEASD